MSGFGQRRRVLFFGLVLSATLSSMAPRAGFAAENEDTGEPIVIERTDKQCHLDPSCFNRLHPKIEPVLRARPGQTLVFETRNASDFDLDPASTFEDPRQNGPRGSTVHPLTGPVYIEGAEVGDVLAVTLLDVEPGPWGYTVLSPIGFLADLYQGRSLRALWRLDREKAVSEEMPGVRIPYAPFPGIVTVLPGPEQLRAILAREQALLEAGGAVRPPEPAHASPSAICGPRGTHRDECLRTAPPREHGGNMDIRYLQAGTTIYLPCRIEGCGLGIGDVHYAQGDGEVSGTAIEMDARVTLTTALLSAEEVGREMRSPHFEGPTSLLGLPGERFYATTGFPLKEAGETPPDLAYLGSSKVEPLENLSKDLGLAARNALREMIAYLVAEHGLTEEQAYLLTSVAVDLRIGQLVDAPNVGAVAILPLDVFVEEGAD